jgi:hypothetical protein
LFFASLESHDLQFSDCKQKRQRSPSPEEEQEVIDVDAITQSTEDRATIDVDLVTIDVDPATIDVDLVTIDVDLATNDFDLATNDFDLATLEVDLATINIDLATHDLDLATLEVDLATIYTDLTMSQMDEGSLVRSMEGLAIPHTVATIDDAIDQLADELANICLKRLANADLSDDIDFNMDAATFEDELQVRNGINIRQKSISDA